MSVDVYEVKGVLIIHPELSRVTALGGAEEFRTVVNKALKDGYLAVAVDLAGVEYADSAMIGTLVDAFKQLNRENGTICLFNVSQELREFFRQTVLDRFIQIFPDEESVLLALEDRPKRKRRKGLRRFFR